jgi:hypothetical protein
MANLVQCGFFAIHSSLTLSYNKEQSQFFRLRKICIRSHADITEQINISLQKRMSTFLIVPQDLELTVFFFF